MELRIKKDIEKGYFFGAVCKLRLYSGMEIPESYFDLVANSKNGIGKSSLLFELMHYRGSTVLTRKHHPEILIASFEDPKVLKLLLELQYTEKDLTFILRECSFNHQDSFFLCLNDSRFWNEEILKSLCLVNPRNQVYWRIQQMNFALKKSRLPIKSYVETKLELIRALEEAAGKNFKKAELYFDKKNQIYGHVCHSTQLLKKLARFYPRVPLKTIIETFQIKEPYFLAHVFFIHNKEIGTEEMIECSELFGNYEKVESWLRRLTGRKRLNGGNKLLSSSMDSLPLVSTNQTFESQN